MDQGLDYEENFIWSVEKLLVELIREDFQGYKNLTICCYRKFLHTSLI